jgi:D-alanyl-D-alanine carboxypeptidase
VRVRGRAASVAAVAGAVVTAAAVGAAALLSGQTANGSLPPRGPATPSASGSAAPAPSWTPAGPVLLPATPRAAPPSRYGLTRRLDGLLSAPALGGQAGATVVDVASGKVLWERRGASPLAPASNVKVATAVAALGAVGPQTRFSTRVLRAAKGVIVLVGGGDPTLTGAGRRAGSDAYADRARIPQLARATAAALRADGVTAVRVTVDDTRFAGPRANPAWAGRYVSTGNVLPVSALALDADAERPGTGQLGADQAVAAGRAFAKALERQGIAVAGAVTRERAPDSAAELASAESPPVSAIVEQMLMTSDNDVAEMLARHVALAEREPPTFAGGVGAVASVLLRLGLDTAGVRLLDGSGLATGNRVPPRALARMVALAASPDRPRLRAAVSGLPVAGFTGTLADRFDATATRGAVGVVRAKTGTLTGVSSLTGLAYGADGRVLAFSFVAGRVPPGGTRAAQLALDRLAAALAACGCR